MNVAIPSRTQAERADLTRSRIFEAAIREFSENGLAGARTERIAVAAGVNKALLYYYFRSKNTLYSAALEQVASRVAASTMAVLDSACSSGEKMLRMALNHFDRIYSQPAFQTLLQQEMVRMRKGEADALSPLVEMLFRPMADKLMGVAAEGIRCGELIRVEPSQMIYATVGPNVFYFLSAPMMRLIGEMNVLDPTALAFRRRAAVEFLAQAIFIDRARGARLAVQVLADTPMPTVSALPKPEVQTGVSPSPRWLQSNIEVGQTSASEVRKK